MSGEAWIFVIVAAAIAAAVGFLVGRSGGKDAKKKLCEVEAELSRKDDELAAYKGQVDAHFDRTATLFVSMAGSYKSLFEHLSSGYEQLSDGRSGRDLFRERVATLLLDGPSAGATAEAVTPDVPPVEPAAEDVAAAEQAVALEEAALKEQAVSVEAEAPGRVEPVIGEESKAEEKIEPVTTVSEETLTEPRPVVEGDKPLDPVVTPPDVPPVEEPADRKP